MDVADIYIQTYGKVPIAPLPPPGPNGWQGVEL